MNLSITESNLSNIESKTLVKSFSLMDAFLRINKEFRNNFKEYLQQAT